MNSNLKVNKYMLKSDLYVMTSISESFSLVLLEASSVGLPLVAFDIPIGPSSIIYNDINGYLIPNRDVKLMASKIVELLKDREKLILELRFGLGGKRPQTQHEIAEQLGISRSYVSRIETKAINKLAAEIKE